MSYIDKVAGNHPVWMLKIKLRCSTGAVSTLMQWAFSPASSLLHYWPTWYLSITNFHIFVSFPIYSYWFVTSFHVEENMFDITVVYLYLLRPVLWFSSWSSLKMFHIHGREVYSSMAIFSSCPVMKLATSLFINCGALLVLGRRHWVSSSLEMCLFLLSFFTLLPCFRLFEGSVVIKICD